MKKLILALFMLAAGAAAFGQSGTPLILDEYVPTVFKNDARVELKDYNGNVLAEVIFGEWVSVRVINAEGKTVEFLGPYLKKPSLAWENRMEIIMRNYEILNPGLKCSRTYVNRQKGFMLKSVIDRGEVFARIGNTGVTFDTTYEGQRYETTIAADTAYTSDEEFTVNRQR